MKKIIFLIIMTAFLTGCKEETVVKEPEDNFIKTIEVETIEVETIEVEKIEPEVITWENVEVNGWSSW